MTEDMLQFLSGFPKPGSVSRFHAWPNTLEESGVDSVDGNHDSQWTVHVGDSLKYSVEAPKHFVSLNFPEFPESRAATTGPLPATRPRTDLCTTLELDSA